MTPGKQCENDIKNSIPKDKNYFFYRFRDNAANFGSGNSNTRFSSNNLCDCLIMAKDKLFFVELKTHKGASLPLSAIRKNQLDGMAKINHPNIRAVFIINFRDKNKTYSIAAKELKNYFDNNDRKSIPIGYLEEHGTEIIAKKKITHYRYDLENYFEKER